MLFVSRTGQAFERSGIAMYLLTATPMSTQVQAVAQFISCRLSMRFCNMKYVSSIVVIRTSRVVKEGNHANRQYWYFIWYINHSCPRVLRLLVQENTAKAVTCPDAGNLSTLGDCHGCEDNCENWPFRMAGRKFLFNWYTTLTLYHFLTMTPQKDDQPKLNWARL